MNEDKFDAKIILAMLFDTAIATLETIQSIDPLKSRLLELELMDRVDEIKHQLMGIASEVEG
jgi:hypothetical protein